MLHKNSCKKASKIVDNELIKLYTMLLKYKFRHPNFNIEKVIVQLYPTLDWDAFLFTIEKHS